jgi:aspartate oxidase
VHGANRLASNSLLEGLVFSKRIVEAIVAAPGVVREPIAPTGTEGLLPHRVRRTMQQAMDRDAGVLRSAMSLADATRELHSVSHAEDAHPCTEDWETTNIHMLATTLVQHARLREETRGSHWRDDYPDRDDARWQVRLVSTLSPDGELRTRTEPLVHGDSAK